MPLMERVREIGADEARIDEETIGRARMALGRDMARERSPRRPRSRGPRWAGIGIGGLVAGTAVTAIVVGSVLAPADAPSASAAVFADAAAGAEETEAMPLQPGQYLRLRTDFRWNVLWDADMPDGARFNNGDPDDAEAVLVIDDRMTTYVPADIGDEWVRERVPHVLVGTRGERSAEARTEWEARGPAPAAEGITRYPGGVAEAGGDGGAFLYHLDDREVYADLPADVSGVIDWFARRYGGEGDGYGLGHYFAETMTDVSAFNLAPPPARAAMLRAFATLEGVEVLSRDDDRATLRYESRSTDGRVAVTDFVLDTARGYVLEVVSWPYDVEPAAEGWTSRTTATVDVVDSAP